MVLPALLHPPALLPVSCLHQLLTCLRLHSSIHGNPLELLLLFTWAGWEGRLQGHGRSQPGGTLGSPLTSLSLFPWHRLSAA